MKMGLAVEQGIRLAFTWRGRASRSEFWFFLLFSGLVYFSCMILSVMLKNAVMVLVWALLFVVPTLGVAARRLHDGDRSAIWLLLALVPLIGILVLLVFSCLPSTVGANGYGLPDDPGAQARQARKRGHRCHEHGAVYLAAGYTALAAVYGAKAGTEVDSDLVLLADQREFLGDRAFRQRLHEVLDGFGVEIILRIMEELDAGPAPATEIGPGE